MQGPIWKRIFDEEVRKLHNGEYPAGKPFSSVNALAGKYRVSTATSRRVLAELARAGAVRNVPRRGSIVIAARQKTVPVYLLSPQELGLPRDALAVSRCVKGLFEEAALSKIDITPVTLDFLLGYRQTAPCVMICHHSANLLSVEAMFDLLPENIFPIVMGAPGKLKRGVAITGNAKQMTAELCRELKSRNCRRIGYCGRTGKDYFLARFESYLDHLRSEGISFVPELFLSGEEWHRNDSLVGDYIARGALDAVFCAGAEDAADMALAIARLGLPIPVAGIGQRLQDSETWLCAADECEQFGVFAVRQAIKLSASEACSPSLLTVPYKIQRKDAAK